ncbi:TonB-like protein [Methylophaga frappieri]|uniref:Protein TonB n=1 Tax=Methylophaga frappieri (strain ATCC BAA-2434 / DSM 25690 / JAM7) TaxID=754477 RepID=I1YHZ3_METFJ|nr:energy transducer TonB [Methylophaga frappieri]AFJ02536.1 TonB-like protein [Methylophaga frappieri]
MRLLLGLLLAILVNFGLFTLMQRMTTSDGLEDRTIEDVLLLDFVRVQEEEAPPETKRRQPPKKPKPPEEPPPPPPAQTPSPEQPDVPQPQLQAPNIDVPMNIAGGPHLGEFQADPVPEPVPTTSQPIMDDDVMPLVRIPPNYPRMAQRRGIEGVVTVSFIITKDGRVRDPQVISATPKNVFDDEALKAVLKWRFKAKQVDGQPVERRATQEIEFTLDR